VPWTATCNGPPGAGGCPRHTEHKIAADTPGAALSMLARIGWLRIFPGGARTDLCPPCADTYIDGKAGGG